MGAGQFHRRGGVITDSATTITVTIPTVQADLDLSNVQRFADTEDGKLVAISYEHQSYYRH